MVHVGAVDSPVTLSEVRDALSECRDNGLKALDVLGWEFEMGLNDLFRQEGQNFGVDLILRSIPREVMDDRAVLAGDVDFYELAHLQLDLVRKGNRGVQVAISDFAISNPELIPVEVREKVKKWSDFIDYWAVDWNYSADTFHNEWQAYRTHDKPTLSLRSETHSYEAPGRYAILVKVIDIFGNDTTQFSEAIVR